MKLLVDVFKFANATVANSIGMRRGIKDVKSIQNPANATHTNIAAGKIFWTRYEPYSLLVENSNLYPYTGYPVILNF